MTGKLYRPVITLGNQVTVLLAHTRHRTRGTEQNSLNNHPIHAGQVIGTHNGHISNADRLVKELHLLRTAEVDSEVLFRLVDRSQSDDEFRKLLARCRGSISAAYVRLDEPARLRLLKGDMPLCAAHVPSLHAVVYASEEWMIDNALDGREYEMLELDPFTLSTFDCGDLLGFTQQDVCFHSPDPMGPLTR